jgi:ribose transport system substrate-binding protein
VAIGLVSVLGITAAACGDDSDESEGTEPAGTTAGTEGGAASGGGAGGTIAIVSPYYAAQPATKEVVDAFTERAEADGYTVTLVDTNNDLTAVNAEMETAVSQGVDAIVLGMGDPQEFGPGLAAAKAAEIPVFGLDAGAVDGVTANITSDNDFLGRESAQAMIDAVGEGGTVAIIHFDPFEPVRLRGAAARALFEEAGIEVIEDVQGDPADSTGFAKTTALDWLNKYPEGEIDGIWAGWDASALGAYQATQEAGRTEVVVTGVDGQDFAREEVRKGGNWIVTVRQDWQGIANKAVDVITAYLGGTAPESQTVVVPGEVLTKDNA